MKSINKKLEDIMNSNDGNMSRLAKYLLTYKGDISKIKSQDICDELFISIASATRLAQKMGFSGFNELKVLLKEENERINIDKKKYDNISLETYLNIVINRLDNSLQGVDENKLQKIAFLIDKFSNIKFYGVGGSFFILEDFAHKIARVKKNIFINSDYHINYVNAINSSKNDLVIAYSNSGITKEIHNLLKLSKNNGAYTILLTCNNKLNSDYIDEYIIVSEIENFKKTYSLSSRICGLVFLDYIFLQYMEINKEEKIKILNKTIYSDTINI